MENTYFLIPSLVSNLLRSLFFTMLIVPICTGQSIELVKDIYPGTNSSQISDFHIYEGELFFFANDPAHGKELWKSDGTSAGTTLMHDMLPGSPSGYNEELMIQFAGQQQLYFFDANNRLWRTDGTVDSIWQVGQFNQFEGVGELDDWVYIANGDSILRTQNFGQTFEVFRQYELPVQRLVQSQEALYFTKLRPIAPGSPFTAYYHELFKVTNTGVDYQGIMASAGWMGCGPTSFIHYPNPDGLFYRIWECGEYKLTYFGKIINSITTAGPSRMYTPAILDSLVFSSTGQWSNFSDYKRNQLSVYNINSRKGEFFFHYDAVGPNYLTAAGNEVYFVAEDSLHGRELWRTSGDSASTKMVVDLLPGVEGSNPYALTAHKGNLIFVTEANDKATFWKTNGSALGTIAIGELENVRGAQGVKAMQSLGDDLLFTAQTQTLGTELWKLKPPVCRFEKVQLCAGESFAGTQWFTSDRLIDTFALADRDSLVITQIEVSDGWSETEVSICEGDNYLFGNSELSEAGTYLDTLLTNMNCDSIAVLQLSIIPANEYMDTSICEGDLLLFMGDTLAQAGNYHFEYTDEHQCMHSLRLNLIVHPAYETQLEFSLEPGTPFNGHAIYSDTILYENYISVHGCDSLVTVQITLLTSSIELDQQNQVRLYPNPAKDYLYFKKRDELQLERIDVFQAQGNRYAAFEQPGKEYIHIANWPPGLYWIRISTNAGYSLHKIIKH